MKPDDQSVLSKSGKKKKRTRKETLNRLCFEPVGAKSLLCIKGLCKCTVYEGFLCQMECATEELHRLRSGTAFLLTTASSAVHHRSAYVPLCLALHVLLTLLSLL